MAQTTSNSTSMYSKRQFGNPILQAIMLIIFLVLFIWFILIPKQQTLAESKQQLGVVEQQQQTLKTDSEELNKLVAKLENSDEEIKLLDELLPLDNRATSSSLMLESYANSSGMDVSQISLTDLDKKISAGNKELLKNPYSANRELITQEALLVLTGNVDQFANFLKLVEDSGRLIDVSELEIISGEAITFRLKINTYEFGVSSVPESEPAEVIL